MSEKEIANVISGFSKLSVQNKGVTALLDEIEARSAASFSVESLCKLITAHGYTPCLPDRVHLNIINTLTHASPSDFATTPSQAILSALAHSADAELALILGLEQHYHSLLSKDRVYYTYQVAMLTLKGGTLEKPVSWYLRDCLTRPDLTHNDIAVLTKSAAKGKTPADSRIWQDILKRSQSMPAGGFTLDTVITVLRYIRVDKVGGDLRDSALDRLIGIVRQSVGRVGADVKKSVPVLLGASRHVTWSGEAVVVCKSLFHSLVDKPLGYDQVASVLQAISTSSFTSASLLSSTLRNLANTVEKTPLRLLQRNATAVLTSLSDIGVPPSNPGVAKLTEKILEGCRNAGSKDLGAHVNVMIRHPEYFRFEPSLLERLKPELTGDAVLYTAHGLILASRPIPEWLENRALTVAYDCADANKSILDVLDICDGDPMIFKRKMLEAVQKGIPENDADLAVRYLKLCAAQGVELVRVAGITVNVKGTGHAVRLLEALCTGRYWLYGVIDSCLEELDENGGLGVAAPDVILSIYASLSSLGITNDSLTALAVAHLREPAAAPLELVTRAFASLPQATAVDLHDVMLEYLMSPNHDQNQLWRAMLNPFGLLSEMIRKKGDSREDDMVMFLPVELPGVDDLDDVEWVGPDCVLQAARMIAW
eukprot:TRINITY_DN1107_c0_g1_i1.p1 TRINITY_DN1107_c0_g1~~TRINITY_DN1107_c0_g1_i1.p1  ORF type:complete len:764 (+),score=57.95 TRINITY_DN1107_c0_g1_i1:335-2293(+)